MKDNFIPLFRSDFKEFVRSNWKILIVCLAVITVIQYFGKGNIIINLSVITLHIIGDVFMIMSMTKFSMGQKKSGFVYMSSSSIFFVTVGFVAVLQSDEGKNWQYFMGTIPFLTANIYQFFDAWEIKGKNFFNYKLTMLIAVVVAFCYYWYDLVYIHSWVQIFGYSMFPVFLGMSDTPRVYLGRIFSVFIMLVGVLIDIRYQFYISEVIPAPALSSFFITLTAFFGFLNNAQVYVEKMDRKYFFTLNTLKVLAMVRKVI